MRQSLRKAASTLFLLFPSLASATPSTTFWAPSTAACQAWRTPHITYDTYFAKGSPAGSAGAPNYPTDVGLTVGFLPFDQLHGEIGFDLLYPTQDPFFLNGKLCAPESVFFGGSPAVSFGIYNVGTRTNVSDYNILHLMVQTSLPGVGGYLSFGAYHGLNEALLTNSDGQVVRTGIMAGVFSPDIEVGLKGLKKINLAADVQTGKNVLGAWGFGSYLFFSETVSLLLGPVFYLDEAAQPGGRGFLWTAQLDADLGF
ncbi:MAG: hypothetical protein NDJ89_13050 [Oligoflexia bacterium]|nr:hypothetical protein [Oligoflexia bacterium]